MSHPRNEKEENALIRFEARPRLEGIKDKGLLMRFLRARNLNLEDAEKMMFEAEEFRHKHIEPSLGTWKYSQFLVDKLKIHYMGNDDKGRSVLYIRWDEWLPTWSMYEDHSTSDVVAFTYHLLWDLHARLPKGGEQQLVAIWDYQDVSWGKVWDEVRSWKQLQTFLKMVAMSDGCFPETLHKAYMINSMRAAIWAWSFVTPWLKPATLAKVSIHGTPEEVGGVIADKYPWLPTLKKDLSADLIPKSVGGNGELSQSLYEYIGAVQKKGLV